MEYAIVEPEGTITQYKLKDGRYSTPKVIEKGGIYHSEVYPDFKFELADIIK